MKNRCFACDRIIRDQKPKMADTRDGQEVFVGKDCLEKILSAGEAGYQPPTGGPKLYPMPVRTSK